MRAVSPARAQSAAVAFSDEENELGVLASDVTARVAQAWEFVLGEGPAHDCAARGPLRAFASQIEQRWPNYGPVVQRLGIHSVAAVPLPAQRPPLGSLVVFGAENGPGDMARLSAIADAFLWLLLSEPSYGSV